MTDIGDRRLEALAIARRGRGPVKVQGQQEYAESIVYRGLRYPILIRGSGRYRRYSLMCPHNGRILGPSYDTKMKAIYAYRRAHSRLTSFLYVRLHITDDATGVAH